MGRWIAYLLALALIPYPSFFAWGESPAKPPSLLARSNVVQFEIVLGRISPVYVHPGYSRSHVIEDPTSSYTETLTTCVEGKFRSVHYERNCATERLKIGLTRSQEFTIHHERFESKDTPDVPTKVVTLRQDERGKTVLSFGDAENTTEFSAPSLWHLMLAEPTVCRVHLLPVLEPLRLAGETEKIAHELRHALLRFKMNLALPDISRINALVVQMGHKEFRQRQAAERELREMGHSVIPILQTYDRLQLDIEQRQRITSVLASLRNPIADTSDRVAHWLVADKSVWLIFLADELPSVRETAAQHLTELAGKSFEFNLAGTGAEREIQIAKLRRTLAVD